MKKIIFILLLTLIIIIPMTNIIAVTSDEYDMVEITDPEKLEYMKNYSNITKIDGKRNDCFMSGYDVNENGEIVVSYHKPVLYGEYLKYINVFDKNGIYQYGFQFEGRGTCFVAWIDGFPSIIEECSPIATLIYPNGEIYKHYDFSNSQDEFLGYLRGKKLTMGNYTYTIKNKEGVRKSYLYQYSMITVTSPDGEERILIDDSALFDDPFNSAKIIDIYHIVFVGFVLITLVTGIIVPLVIKKEDNEKQEVISKITSCF